MSIDTTKKIKQVTYNGKDIPLRGYDTSDATVTAGDMARNVIAYGKDGKVTGSLVRSNNPSNANSLGGTSISSGDGTIWFGGYFDEGTVIASKSKMGAPLEFLGDATAADVAKGKTFTSAAGLKVTGTASSSSGSSFEGASLAAYDELVYGVGFALNARNSYIVNIPYGEVVAIIEKRAFTYLDTAYSNVLNDNLKITGSTNGNLLYSEGTATSENRNLSITSFEF